MPKKKNPTYGPAPIQSVTHQDKRTNIPTEELRGFVADDEKQPTKVLYPRDPSLDPQLVWQGKDEQDSQDLEVMAVPIYIQEKIHPHALIEDFRAQRGRKPPEEQMDLFSHAFEELDFTQQIEFYEHEQNWANRMILGDSLLVMNSLAEKERLRGKVQMIYLDPPYGIKFGSNWQVSTRKCDVKDGKLEDVSRQPEQIRAFRDTWEKGIHSYLAYLRDRLVTARELLTETGSIFVQIGDENVHLVRCLMDEILGSDNFISLITFKKTSAVGSFGGGTNVLPSANDYLVWYSKSIELVKYRPSLRHKDLQGAGGEAYRIVELPDGIRRPAQAKERSTGSTLGKFLRASPLTSITVREAQTTVFPVDFQGKVFLPGGTRGWSTNKLGMERLRRSSRLMISGKSLSFVRYLEDFPVFPITNLWDDTQSGSAMEKIYAVQTNVKVIERCLLMTTDPGDLVLDPTCGSGTTAYVAEQWGRRWITIDTSRVAFALARTRLMSAKFPYYLLADSPEGRKKEADITGIPLDNVVHATFSQTTPKAADSSDSPLPEGEGPGVRDNSNIKKGFVYKRVPHITLKAIANNPEIDTIHAQWQAQLEPIRTQLNQHLNQSWEDWQIPRDPDDDWSDDVKALLTQWWDLRQQRQQDIDESISRNSDPEILYDQPYKDEKRVRVTGPFTVESLSPHRMIAPQTEDVPESEAIGTQHAADQFETRIIENLRKAGVQNTKKEERLNFDSLEPFPGTWIHATGSYTETDDTSKRVAISIGSEYGTVGTDDIKEAAKEAVQGLGYDLLLVCGFAFDAAVSEEAKRFGNLTVLPVRINQDLLLGDDLLKKTKAANLFMVFGEPDIDIHKHDDGTITVELKGLDIYDPTTGAIRSSSADKDIACWFIDTHYNSESFFVRHAYFTGANQPYDKLKKALNAEIDEDAWSALYSTTSRPFPIPTHNGKPGKIAIKVINHYGDEVLKVYEVE